MIWFYLSFGTVEGDMIVPVFGSIVRGRRRVRWEYDTRTIFCPHGPPRRVVAAIVPPHSIAARPQATMARAVRSLLPFDHLAGDPGQVLRGDAGASPRALPPSPCRRGPIDLPPLPLTSPAATSAQVLRKVPICTLAICRNSPVK